jgi:hypothetical protein
MLKKGKTRADQKEDAFERLYAILAAGTPGLPALEKPPMPSAPSIKLPPTQEDKEKEQAEFNKLYAQLAALSSRKKEEVPLAQVVPLVAPMVAPVAHAAHAVPMVAHVAHAAHAVPLVPVAQVQEQHEFDEIYAQIVRMIAMKTQLEPHVLLPPPKKPKNDLQCDACCKTFCNSSSFIRHKRLSEACKAWYALPEEKQPPLVTTPIHEMVNELLERAITGNQPLTCKFCSTTFYNRGNHHKHYQSAQTCNRMAYAEFKRITAL